MTAAIIRVPFGDGSHVYGTLLDEIHQINQRGSLWQVRSVLGSRCCHLGSACCRTGAGEESQKVDFYA